MDESRDITGEWLKETEWCDEYDGKQPSCKNCIFREQCDLTDNLVCDDWELDDACNEPLDDYEREG